jgi:hypothetical protein
MNLTAVFMKVPEGYVAFIEEERAPENGHKPCTNIFAASYHTLTAT